jgi:hypothetical protein
MNAGAEQCFIGVNIADAAHKCLIKEQRLDARLVAAEFGREFIEGISRARTRRATRRGNSLNSMQPNWRYRRTECRPVKVKMRVCLAELRRAAGGRSPR